MELERVYFGDQVLNAVQSFIQQIEGNATGFLFGIGCNVQLYVQGYATNSDDSQDKLKDALDKVTLCLPGGLQVCGIFLKTQQADNEKLIKTVCQRLFSKNANLKEGFGFDQLLVLAMDQTTSECYFHWFLLESEELKPAEVVSATDSVFRTSFVVFRLHAGLPFSFEHLEEPEVQLDSLLGEMQYLEDQVTSDAVVFRIKDCSALPLIYSTQPNDDQSELTVSDILDSCPAQLMGEAGSQLKAKKSVSSENAQPFVEVRMSLLSTQLLDSEYWSSCTPVIHHEHIFLVADACIRPPFATIYPSVWNNPEHCENEQFQSVKLTLPLDVLAYASCDLPVSSLASVLTEGVVRQLRAMAHCLVMECQDDEYNIPKPFHFSVQKLHHVITVVYPDAVSDAKLDAARRWLHGQFSIPLTQPVFRKANAFQFTDSQSCSASCLADVHIGLNSPTVPGGQVHIVRGHYSYHHYMQDGIDDNGWGCAYRSLQTIVSWLRLQAYTDKSIPSHAEIQQALVAVGDKPANFVGSKKWIGSTEVSYVLDHLFEITCKIVHVSSGEEMATKARELARHFETQGTPVMIGGGVLAHTILGVDWNEATGDVKFLILDPHYTGAEDMQTIQDKGWCGWKTVDFWDKTAYYNMCLPQCPDMF